MNCITATTDRQSDSLIVALQAISRKVLAALDAKIFMSVDEIVAQLNDKFPRDVVVEHLDNLKQLGFVRTENVSHKWRLTKEGVDALADGDHEPASVEAEPDVLLLVESNEDGEADQQVLSLTGDDRQILDHCEKTIERGLGTFIDVGRALLTIRNEHLYRDTHLSFEHYCRERWDFGRNYVNKQIAAANVVERLGTTVPILPATESQARPLTTVDPEEVGDVWREVLERAPEDADGKPKVTAKQVGAVVREKIEEKEKAEAKEEERRAKAKARRKSTKATVSLYVPAEDDADRHAAEAEDVAVNESDEDAAEDVSVRDDDAEVVESVGSTVREWITTYAAVLGDEDLRTLIVVARETLDRIEAERFGGTGG